MNHVFMRTVAHEDSYTSRSVKTVPRFCLLHPQLLVRSQCTSNANKIKKQCEVMASALIFEEELVSRISLCLMRTSHCIVPLYKWRPSALKTHNTASLFQTGKIIAIYKQPRGFLKFVVTKTRRNTAA